ncbi:activity-regulated cytoskeleton associated protein 1-like isoform X2 [Manduca sexta]|uniref:activity-regulated cytoskeleton associated protein 1-like isoform X2 n=1 Tax=Manduca sexta TaxID=7130 RepID=UPI00188E5920|nr:activity-regulated cytoskeleton associated protein 1-like isoform X2 [Manduca sexta]
MNSDEGPPALSSEVGSNGMQNEEKLSDTSHAEKLLSNMERLLSRVLAIPQTPTVSTNRSPLLKFDPDDSESDIDDWCKVTEIIVTNKGLEGVDLLIALTGALKGRAGACIAKLNLEEITWSSVKEILIARFSKPKLIQDYFDDVLRFKISANETASESALRLWNLIEKIPNTKMSEEVITGFVISVLCQKDNMIRRELNAQTITSRALLFRILGGISLKRRLDAEAQEPEAKRVRLVEKFSGKCHYCGLNGHRIAECRKRRNDRETKTQEPSSSSRLVEKKPAVTCYACGQPGHVATACLNKKNSSAATVKEVQQCEHRPSRGTLRTSSETYRRPRTVVCQSGRDGASHKRQRQE